MGRTVATRCRKALRVRSGNHLRGVAGMNGNQVRSYADFEVWINRAGAVPNEFPVQVFVSPDGYGEGVMALDVHTEDFQAKLVRVCGQESNFNLRRDFGALLFDALFTGGVRDRWIGSIARLRSSPRPIGLRLLLRIPDAELSLLPWEILYDRQTSSFLGATATQTVLRLLPMAEPEDFRVPETLRVLLVIQNPEPGASDMLRPIPADEVAGLKLALTSLRPSGVEVTVLENQSSATIQEELQRSDYHVLHYLGHGSAGELYLVAEETRPFRAIQDVQFSYWFSGRKSLRLIVLNACSSSQSGGTALFSGIGPASVSVSVPAVIAMQYDSVYTDTAGFFSQRFYAGLVAGLPVDVAVNEARQVLLSKDPAVRDWSTPVLYMGTRSGRILTLPGSERERNFEQMAQALAKVTAALKGVGPHQAELNRRANRLREWLDVQSALSSARTDVDRMVSYILDALSGFNSSDQVPVNAERVRAKLTSMADKWTDDCSEALKQLKDLLEACSFITQIDPDGASQQGRSSAAGWVADLDRVFQESSAFGQDMAAVQDDALKSSCLELDNKSRRLRDWLRDRDNECRTSLKGESVALAALAERLQQWARANEKDQAAAPSTPLASQ
jgi:hypothetical protein